MFWVHETLKSLKWAFEMFRTCQNFFINITIISIISWHISIVWFCVRQFRFVFLPNAPLPRIIWVCLFKWNYIWQGNISVPIVGKFFCIEKSSRRKLFALKILKCQQSKEFLEISLQWHREIVIFTTWNKSPTYQRSKSLQKRINNYFFMFHPENPRKFLTPPIPNLSRHEALMISLQSCKKLLCVE